MTDEKTEPWYKKGKALIGFALAAIGLLTVLGYNVKASMPPTRTEVTEMIAPIQESVQGTLEMAQSNQEWIMVQQFEYLKAKYISNGGLDANDQRALCILANALRMSAPGCS